MKSASHKGDREPYDICIIGGGINGCGIARDAAGRGYRVILAEMGDLGSATSSGSTKLIHGGLRYLEHLEFRLVREALRERELLWRNAPHIVRPLRFVLPVGRIGRPGWLLRLGLFIYDHLGARKLLPSTSSLDLRSDPMGQLFSKDYRKAFEFSDAWVDDARLVILNARDAAERGAHILTRTKVIRAARKSDRWLVEMEEQSTRQRISIDARLLINAAGPWVDRVARDVLDSRQAAQVRLVQGSHIVVPRLSSDPRACFLQNQDGRVVFAIPFEDDFTLIGTTDREIGTDPSKASISQAEIDYLCSAVSQYLRRAVSPEDIVWSYAAVRSLVADGASKAQEATRDYVLRLDAQQGTAPLVTVLGGKITTYRRLAEAMMVEVETALGARRPAWTAASPLPGGDFAIDGTAGLLSSLEESCPFLGKKVAKRLVHLYGTMAADIVAGARSLNDLGIHFGAGLYQAEVDYLIAREWARTSEDIVWRRTKLGLIMTAEELAGLRAYMARATGLVSDTAGKN